LTQPLYNSNISSRHSQNKAFVQQADADFQAAEQDLIVRVARQYFRVLGAQDNLEFSKAEKNANERQLEQTKQRFEVGLVVIIDVYEV
jgi:outer membrane protein